MTAETSLFRIGASGAARRVRAATAAAVLGFEQALADLRRDVKGAYTTWRPPTRGTAVARQGLEQAQARRRLVDDLVQAGQAALIDQLQADVQVEEAVMAQADAAEGRDLAAARLLQLLGAGPFSPLADGATSGVAPVREGPFGGDQLTRLRKLTSGRTADRAARRWAGTGAG